MMLEKVKEYLHGLIRMFMMVIGSIIKKMDLEFILKLMAVNMKENGIKIR